MNTLMKYVGAATLAAGLALTCTAGQAHDLNTGAAVGGFVAGAAVGAAVAGGPYYGAPYYDNYAYGPGYNDYAYEPGYDTYAYDPGTAYGYGYAYAPRGQANFWGRSRSLNHGQGPGCIQSPASHEYTSCD